MGGEETSNSHSGSWLSWLRAKSTSSDDESLVRSLKFARITIYSYLVIIMVLLPYFAYDILKQSEEHVRYAQYDYVADGVERNILDFWSRSFDSMDVVGVMFGEKCPTAAHWPNCTFHIDTFQKLVDPVAKISPSMSELRMSPIVSKQEVAAFENFSFDFFAAEGYPHLGISSLGKVMTGRNVSDNLTVYHSTEEFEGGKNPIFAPVLFTGSVATTTASVYMYNMYTDPVKVDAIDMLYDCVANGTAKCHAISDNSLRFNGIDPMVVLVTPIFPSSDGTTIAGLVVTVVNWIEAIETVKLSADGVDVVVEGPGLTFTFCVKRRRVVYLGQGDMHDRKYDDFAHVFTVPASANVGSSHHVTVYATDDFGDEHDPNYPFYGCFVVLGVLLACVVAIFWYDYLVHDQSRERKQISRTKRLFVRYISHEIRTPLNTVHVGLVVLASELKAMMAKAALRSNESLSGTLSSWFELVGDIADSSDNATSVLSDLITYDKILSNKLQLQYSAVPFLPKVYSAVKLFGIPLRDKHIDIRVDVEIIDGDDSLVFENAKLSQVGEASGEMQKLLLLADEIKIGQVLKNLLSNAVKFTPKHGRIVVTVRWEKYVKGAFDEAMAREHQLKPIGFVSVVVEDSGAGMAADEVRDLFQDGVQFNANELQNGQGSGLGLWVSRGFAEQHRGTLTAVSAGRGKGSAFTLRLPAFSSLEAKSGPITDPEPLCPPSSTAVASLRSIELGGEGDDTVYYNVPQSSDDDAGPASVLTTGLSTMNSETPHPDGDSTGSVTTRTQKLGCVLVVDDAVSNRKVLCRLLRNNGYECVEVCDGAEAVALLKQTPPALCPFDFILMDYEMPVMNGPEATKVIRTLGLKMPVIGVTGNVMTEDSSIFIKNGANAVLHKPLSLDMLRSTLNSLDLAENSL